jgi:selenocysteine lyase/cysteine desulfurase
VLDLTKVVAASKEIVALVVVDAVQAVGWLPPDVSGVDTLSGGRSG